jgi:heme exporter protein D
MLTVTAVGKVILFNAVAISMLPMLLQITHHLFSCNNYITGSPNRKRRRKRKRKRRRKRKRERTSIRRSISKDIGKVNKL